MSRILIKDGTVLIERVKLAESTAERIRGLLGRKALPADSGMLIRPCRSIHMWFMHFPIDAAFLDRDMRVLKVVRNLKPWRMAFAPPKTYCVLESAVAVMVNLEPGDQLTLK